mmetsp:Transcript_8559/g.12602  ORF Transcript_8559/g.12602 Transcript_8559/m.12602 type:complete len:115 (-) Transcript_8559:327-671(-)|eukprot:CAMPEP_0197250506 /NCGR_PEP_ID=MMETSP1429-20130617/53172_1 /TAXON_ID=49237 /ORGANISM="Chaetoceros  sp., Strain UNC1202" /LENGTH=114 /DNA_ID=CAMNT_0042712351 /DNA_START=43 /DNA_END=387 /DNA_ORIENTATION=-
MPRPKKTSNNTKGVKRPRSKSPAGPSSSTSASLSSSNTYTSAGYLLSCDAPTKQYIKQINESKNIDKRFIIEDLDATHLLIKPSARDEILRKIEKWMDSNVFSSVDRLGENLET